MCKNENEWYRDMIIPEEYHTKREPPEEERADLITIHIYKDQIVKLTEDVIRWMFHKVKGMFKRKKKQRKENARHDKEKE